MLALMTAASLAFSGAAMAADYEVKMLNKGANGQAMVFEPALVKLEAGDTVTFVATDRGHNAETETGMLPAGAEPFKTKLGQTETVTFSEPGLYTVVCRPHRGMGMVALIEVGGDRSNLAALKEKALPKKTQERLDALYAELEAN